MKPLKILFISTLLVFLGNTFLYAEHNSDHVGNNSSAIANGTNLLNSFLGNSNEFDILDAEDAFRVELNSNEDKFIVKWSAVDAYYLYRNKMKVTVDDKAIDISLPQGELKDDPLFGKVQVFYQSVATQIPLNKIKGETLRIHYQGCADIGVCYPPQQQIFKISDLSNLLIATANASELSAQKPTSNALQNTNSQLSETDTIISQLANSTLWLTVVTFFLAGLLLAFTPCVFPLIPILSGILSQQKEALNSRSGLRISTIYVLSMSITYTIAGVLAAVLGKNLQATLQNPWLLGSFSLIFVLLALSMFGFYQLQLPLSWQNKLNNLSNRQNKSSSTLGVVVMGLLSALIVGPCVTPPLAGALIYIGQSGDAFTGGLSLFAMSIGMGTPLIMMGTFAGRFLPKSGAWMKTVQAVFGVFMLALAIYFLDRFIATWLSMLLWSSLFIISAVYMGAFTTTDTTKSKWQHFYKGIAWILIMIGFILLLGLASGGRSLLQPLKHLTIKAQNTTNALATESSFFQPAQIGEDLRNKLTQAKNAKQPAMYYVTADWCISCKELELFTFGDEQVVTAMNQQIAYKIDVTDNTASDEKFLRERQLVGPPSILFFDSNGEEIRRLRVIGMISATRFLQHINAWKQS